MQYFLIRMSAKIHNEQIPNAAKQDQCSEKICISQNRLVYTAVF